MPAKAFEAARLQGRVALSRPVYDEIVEVLNRPRLARYIQPALRARLLEDLAVASAWYAPAVRVRDCRDANDNKVLELALAAGAAMIVTSDADLLVLDPWRGIRILRPADYLRTIVS